jgi:small conductance mechanosensitive channel
MELPLRHFVFALGLFATLVMPVMANAQDTQPSGAISVEDSAQQDAAIAVRIRDILSELDGYGDVSVSVSSGIVTMRGQTLESEAIARLDDLVSRVEGVVAIENQVVETTDLAERLNPAVDRFRTRVQQTIAFLPLVAVAFTAAMLVLFLGLTLARMRQPWDRMAPNAFIADIYRQILRLAFAIAAIVVALDILNATALLSTILGAAGIIGLAIGFAVRDTVENFIASIMLSIRQPFRPNDAVEIGGDTGKVIRLTSRATILLSFDGNHIRIPNATVFKSRIVNYSRNAERRFLFDIGIEADSDIGATRSLAEEVVQSLPFTLSTPAASTWIEEINDSGVILRVTGWVDQRNTSLVQAKGEALRQVKSAIEASGVGIPDTTYRLRLDPPISFGDQLINAAPSEPVAVQPIVATIGAAPVLDDADVGAEDEEALEEMIATERKELAAEDLLNTAAPEE